MSHYQPVHCNIKTMKVGAGAGERLLLPPSMLRAVLISGVTPDVAAR